MATPASIDEILLGALASAAADAYDLVELIAVMIEDEPTNEDRIAISDSLAALGRSALIEIKNNAVRVTGLGAELDRSLGRLGSAKRQARIAAELVPNDEGSGRWTIPDAAWDAARTRAYDRVLGRIEFRLEIVDGLLKALASVAEVNALITSAPDRTTARRALCEALGLTEIQANHVLDLTFARQTQQARQELLDEHERLMGRRTDVAKRRSTTSE